MTAKPDTVSLDKGPQVKASAGPKVSPTEVAIPDLTSTLVDSWKQIRRDLVCDKTIAATTCAHCLSVCVISSRCSRCKYARYCSKPCQRAAWPEHKALCQPKLEYKLLAKFLRKIGVYVLQPAFADILHDIKKRVPEAAAVQVDYQDILKFSPNVNQQIDHLIWYLIGGCNGELNLIFDDKAERKIAPDGVMRLGVFYRGNVVRAFRAGGVPVSLDMLGPGGALEGQVVGPDPKVFQGLSTPVAGSR